MTPKTAELYSLGVNAYLDDNYIHLHGSAGARSTK